MVSPRGLTIEWTEATVARHALNSPTAVYPAILASGLQRLTANVRFVRALSAQNSSELESGLLVCGRGFCHRRWHTATAHKMKISGLAYECKLAR
jgi:hypothetical protein